MRSVSLSDVYAPALGHGEDLARQAATCAYSLMAPLESRRHEEALKTALKELGEARPKT
ncbi:MAG: hypothetical protein ACYC2I_11165 [Elusimicrobiales bacterium]